MKLKLVTFAFVATVSFSALADPTGGIEVIESRFGKLAFENGFTTGYPTEATATALFNEMHFQRANQAYIWSIPLVSMYEWKNSLERMDSEDGRILYVESYEAKLGGLTYNTSTPYALTFVNIEKEPLVVEIPTDQIRGAAHNMWQIGLEQMTQPGTYVFIAEGSEVPANIPKDGKVIASNTNYIFIGLRLMADTSEERLQDLEDITFRRLDGSHVSGKDPVFPEKGDNAKHPRGMDFWKVLDQAIQSEPIHERDRIMHDMLRPLGIQKGMAFAPDAMQKAILEEAVVTGEAMVMNIDFNKDQYLPHARYGGEGSMWDIATVSTPNQDRDGGVDLDGRAAWFYEAVTNDIAMHGLENGGWGQVYLDCYKDADGNFLDGGKHYTLNIPAGANYADLFWTITAYNTDNRAIIVNETKKADVGSNVEGTVASEDGSFTFHFASEKPEGVPGANWIQTNKGEGWFVYFRAYSPTKNFVEQEPGTIVPNFELVK